jgi:hypothetical protein
MGRAMRHPSARIVWRAMGVATLDPSYELLLSELMGPTLAYGS